MKTSVVFGIAALAIGFVLQLAWSIAISFPIRSEKVTRLEPLHSTKEEENLAAEMKIQPLESTYSMKESGNELEVMPPLLGGEELPNLRNEQITEEAKAALVPAPDPFTDAQRIAQLLTDQKLTFKAGGKQLDERSSSALTEVAREVATLPENFMLEIRGHTDSQGSAVGNMKVSLKRAESVRDALVHSGISTERLRAVGYGSTHPIASNSTEEGRAQNRRIEFLVRKIQ